MRKHAAPNAGYTLMEMLAASASATVVVAGLTSAMIVASQTLDLSEQSVAARARGSRAVTQVLDDVSEALAFSERTPTAITFTVPDRTGDDAEEEIRYAWSGVEGDPLVYSLNGVSSTLVDEVKRLDFDYITRTIDAPVIDTGETISSVVFESVTEAQRSSDGQSITVATPPDVVENDLLIAATVVDDTPDNLDAPSGWTLLDRGRGDGNKLTFGVWWKLAGASEPSSHTFTWDNNERAYGWIMRFTGHDVATPIDDSKPHTGKSDGPDSPEVTTGADYGFILRLGGFDDDDVTNGDAGVDGHTTICAGESNNGSGSVSGAAAFATQAAAGGSGTAEFTLGGSEEYRTVTIAISPEED